MEGLRPRLRRSFEEDHFEHLHPEENNPTAFFYKLLAYRPQGSEEWDSEDVTLFMGDMHAWLSTTSFGATTHPRLFSVSSLASMLVFCATLETVADCETGKLKGCQMVARFYPKTITEKWK